LTETVVEDIDMSLIPAQCDGALSQCVLPGGGFSMLVDLLECRLAEIHGCASLQVARSNLLVHR
jgi:hypothetical protein